MYEFLLPVPYLSLTQKQTGKKLDVPKILHTNTTVGDFRIVRPREYLLVEGNEVQVGEFTWYLLQQRSVVGYRKDDLCYLRGTNGKRSAFKKCLSKM